MELKNRSLNTKLTTAVIATIGIMATAAFAYWIYALAF